LSDNYLSFNGGANPGDSDTFAQQYLPEIYEQEVERYGNRTLSGFLRMVGAEMPMTSDQVIWSEQNRLHVAYNDVDVNAGGVATNILEFAVGGAGDTFTENVISKDQTIVILDASNSFELKALVTESSQTGAVASITVAPYTQADLTGLSLTGLKIFVYGSEYGKGKAITNSTGLTDTTGYKTITPSFTQYANSPIIIRNKYVETRLRFEDYLEMSVVEGELAAAGSGAATAGVKGTQGLFAAIKDRGNVNAGFTAANGLESFDDILKNLDTQGAIEENMLFLNRQTALDFDDMLAQLSLGTAGGTAYGLFENSEEMALNLGFSGFRRGSYDFYKTDWKYLNDASTRGGIDTSCSYRRSIGTSWNFYCLRSNLRN